MAHDHDPRRRFAELAAALADLAERHDEALRQILREASYELTAEGEDVPANDAARIAADGETAREALAEAVAALARIRVHGPGEART